MLYMCSSHVNSVLASQSSTRRLIKFTGTMNGRQCVFMLDSGATGNFVSLGFVQKHSFVTSPLPRQDTVTLADGSKQVTGSMVQAAAVRIGSYADRLDLVTLPLTGYDVILGMPWLYHYNPVVDWQLESLSFVQHHKRFKRKRVLQAAPPVATFVSSVRSAVPATASSSTSVPKGASPAPGPASVRVPSSSVSSDESRPGLSVNLLSSSALRRDIRRGLVEQVAILRYSDLRSLV